MIYKREGSKYYQALIRFDEYRKRISTHTTHHGSARQFTSTLLTNTALNTPNSRPSSRSQKQQSNC
jgi:hypothetical protein